MAYVSSTEIGLAAPAVDTRPGLLARFVNALVESRMRAAEREIRRHRAHFGPTLKDAGLAELNLGTADVLPFKG
ncbi:hypothetical protein QNA08_10145 [Chelatococcus sp. SYSU_G07232]|uniref:DUF1127 domain-containing protein n=1 Tax=Chelatococcus albus TaxID=3047466 RepID=A0ABT7AGU1_9HYPH|nr:hypothetical protein [Chelatococcus sp. SYSU_G07232]MDJ1158595.1 hypothetical protein [Chelatococcus sp. SYSU_G07232]